MNTLKLVKGKTHNERDNMDIEEKKKTFSESVNRMLDEGMCDIVYHYEVSNKEGCIKYRLHYLVRPKDNRTLCFDAGIGRDIINIGFTDLDDGGHDFAEYKGENQIDEAITFIGGHIKQRQQSVDPELT